MYIIDLVSEYQNVQIKQMKTSIALLVVFAASAYCAGYFDLNGKLIHH